MDKNLSDRLNKLGVHLGANHIKAPTPKINGDPALILGLKNEFQNRFGVSIAKDTYYKNGYTHGNYDIFDDSLYRDPIKFDIESGFSFEDCLFIDTETTGISKSVGTFTFMVGIGAIEKGQFYLRQYFLRNPGEEQAMLLDLANYVDRYKVLVSYNGIGFDVPILKNRYKLYRLTHPFKNKLHIDLLKHTRKLLRFQFDDRSLKNMEVEVLGFRRSDEEIPGWMVPDMYRDYLKTGNFAPMAGVFYHNAMDIVSLGVLLKVINEINADSAQFSAQYNTINFALAYANEKGKNLDKAKDIYTIALKQTNLDSSIRLKCLENLAMIFKKERDFVNAEYYWLEALDCGSEMAFIELAKHFEHQLKDYETALNYVNQLLDRIANKETSLRIELLINQIEHRKNRLQTKLERDKKDE